MRRWVISALVAVALAGCGGEDEPEGDTPERTVRTYLVALAEGDGERACAQLTRAGQAELSGFVATQLGLTRLKDCVGMTEQLSDVLPETTSEELLDSEIGEIEVDGGKATASPPGGPERIILVRRRGDWLIDKHLEAGWYEIGLTEAPEQVPPSQVPGNRECDPALTDCG